MLFMNANWRPDRVIKTSVVTIPNIDDQDPVMLAQGLADRVVAATGARNAPNVQLDGTPTRYRPTNYRNAKNYANARGVALQGHNRAFGSAEAGTHIVFRGKNPAPFYQTNAPTPSTPNDVNNGPTNINAISVAQLLGLMSPSQQISVIRRLIMHASRHGSMGDQAAYQAAAALTSLYRLLPLSGDTAYQAASILTTLAPGGLRFMFAAMQQQMGIRV